MRPKRGSRAEGTAGATAQARYESLYRPWRRRVRIITPAVFAAMFVLYLPVLLFFPDQRGFYLGLIVGVFIGTYVALVESPPDWMANWRRGAEGEKRTAKVLRKLPDHNWTVVHDIERDRSNIDHVVVGPTGVFLLDTKVWNGAITVGRGKVICSYGDGPYDQWTGRAPTNFVKASAAALSTHIGRESGVRTFVEPVVVVWGDFQERVAEDDGVPYVRGERLVDWLVRKQPRLTPSVSKRIAAVVAER